VSLRSKDVKHFVQLSVFGFSPMLWDLHLKCMRHWTTVEGMNA
jgi:hypothetical protein